MIESGRYLVENKTQLYLMSSSPHTYTEKQSSTPAKRLSLAIQNKYMK